MDTQISSIMMEKYMQEALLEARLAFAENETPVGAVLVCNDRIIARAHNLTERLRNATAHAEMQVIAAAGEIIGSRYLSQSTMYVTLEPCPMCAAAMFWSQLDTLVYGAPDIKRGYTLVGVSLLHRKTNIVSGIMAQECGALLTDFFKRKRV